MRLPRVRFTVRSMMIALAVVIVCALAAGMIEGITASTAEAIAVIFALSYSAEVALALVYVMRLLRRRSRLQPRVVPSLAAVTAVIVVGAVESPYIRGWACHAACERYFLQAIAEGDPEPVKCREQAADHARRRRNCRHAMLHPWKPICLDREKSLK